MMGKIDLNKISRIYFVGVKGVAMAALAILAKELGKTVAGSDTEEDFPTSAQLKKYKIKVKENFQTQDIRVFKPDLVIYTGAHGGRDNPQVAEALKLGIAVLPHGAALGIFMSGRKQISVAGSHGKTTTAAMIATILSSAGLNPSYAIGCGEIFGLGAAGHAGQGNLFVAEADEYMTDPNFDRTPRFAWQHPEILVVTNIDYDHPDAYKNIAEVREAFLKLRNSMGKNGHLVISADDVESQKLGDTQLPVSTVGLANGSDYQVCDIHFSGGQTYFSLKHNGLLIGEFLLKIPGKHNAVNAGMAAVAASLVGVDWPAIRAGLVKFGGTKRRFEKLGETDKIIFYDDYAHHPKEIAATILAARDWYPKRRLICVFQPHTYSRTKALLGEFAQAFNNADLVILTDIYSSAREKDTLGISGETLAEETRKFQNPVIYAQNYDAVLKSLERNCRQGDVVVFMGAGNIYLWGREIVKQLSNPTNKYQSDQ